MTSKRHLAVDLGASGGRVALGTIREGKLDVEILHRFPNGGVTVRGELYWDILGLWREILHGLSLAGGEVVSVGVNSWGVDYGLLDAEGRLLEGVHHYRSARTDGVMEATLEALGREKLYGETGIQFMPINTAYQLVAHRSAPAFGLARRLLMVPDLLHYWLSGQLSNEQTIASTSQLYNPREAAWSETLLTSLDIPAALFGPISTPGTVLGELLPEVAAATGLQGTKVVLPASHDTASAVAAVPAEGEHWAYVSSGTWSLVGVEVAEPVLTPEAMAENLTNEAGVHGTTRLLKNVMGLWIIQECQRAWGNVPFETLYAEAEAAEGGYLFDPDHLDFLPPGADMPSRVRVHSGVGEDRGAITRCVLESLAQKTADILTALERVTGRDIRTVHVVGGGSQIAFLNRLIAQRSGRPVVAGPIEATLIGNLLVQAEACGSIPPGTLRAVVRATTRQEVFGQEVFD